MLQSILSNLAIILLLHLTMTFLLSTKDKLSSLLFYLLRIIVISASVIAMFYLPIRFNNYWVDMRMIPLVFFAYIQGGKVAIPALIISSVWRFFMGGDGMIPGILFGMIGPTLLALLLHLRYQPVGYYFEKIGLIIVCWLISDLPIIFLMPSGLEIFKSIALIRSTSLVATAIILYTFIILERQRRTLNIKLIKLADEDPLTKLLNKRKILETIYEQMYLLSPDHYIAMMDIDFFKKINDTYGHVIGDEVLIKVSEIFKQYETDTIKIGRYGGEEFIVYMGNTTYHHAKSIIEEIQEKVKTTAFPSNSDSPIHITLSIGLATLTMDAPLIHSINQADKNLYRAKKSGRDCIVAPLAE